MLILHKLEFLISNVFLLILMYSILFFFIQIQLIIKLFYFCLLTLILVHFQRAILPSRIVETFFNFIRRECYCDKFSKSNFKYANLTVLLLTSIKYFKLLHLSFRASSPKIAIFFLFLNHKRDTQFES